MVTRDWTRVQEPAARASDSASPETTAALRESGPVPVLVVPEGLRNAGFRQDVFLRIAVGLSGTPTASN